MRYFFEIAYNGTNYSGWQRQNNTSNTVQECIESSMRILLGTDVSLISCGRTDKGVHARSFFFHIDIESKLPSEFQYKLNRILPEDILVKDIQRTQGKAHARFSARSRIYHYYFNLQHDVFQRGLSYHVSSVPDFKKMQSALDIISVKDDFRNFCKSPDRHESTICKIKDAKLVELGWGQFYIRIQANRFLKSMMRIIAFRVLTVGLEKLSLEEFELSFSYDNPKKQIEMLAPHGLFLEEIKYDWESILVAV